MPLTLLPGVPHLEVTPSSSQHAWCNRRTSGFIAADFWLNLTPNKRFNASSSNQNSVSSRLSRTGLRETCTASRELLTALCDSQFDSDNLVTECTALLKASPIREDRLIAIYLQSFTEKWASDVRQILA